MGGPDPAVIAAGQQERLDVAKGVLSESRIAGGAELRSDGDGAGFEKVPGTQRARAGCSNRTVEAVYDPYARALTLTFERREDDLLDEGWTKIKVDGKVVDSGTEDETLGLRIDDGKKDGASFSWTLGGKHDQRDALISTGAPVELKIEVETKLSRRADAKAFTTAKGRYEPVVVGLYGFSAAEAKAMRKHRGDVRSAEATLLEYDERAKSDVIEELESLPQPEAREVLRDFASRHEEAREVFEALPESPGAEHAGALTVRMQCKE